MKTKIKLLSLVLGISLSGILFTQCVKNEESDGVRAVRQGYAAKLAGDADYQKALAEKERANAEYIKLQAQWEKAEHEANVELTKVQVELNKVNVELAKLDIDLKKLDIDLKKVTLEYEQAKLEYQKNLWNIDLQIKLLELEHAKIDLEKAKIELEKAVLDLEVTKAQQEVLLQNIKNALQAAQQAFAKAVLDNEAALIAAEQALAKAKAELLAGNPNLEEYQKLYGELFVNPGYYGQKLTLLGQKLDKQSEIIELQYAVQPDYLVWLKRDSVKAAENLKYGYALLEKYEQLENLSVAELQAKADDAEIDWKKAQVEAQALKVVETEKTGIYNEENAKLTVENNKLTAEKTKLNSIKGQLTTSTTDYPMQEVITDSLYLATLLTNTGAGNNANIYPAPLNNLVSASTVSRSGAQTILNLATGRLAYLQSASTALQPSGFGNAYTPAYNYPNKKWLEDRIAHIENNLLPSVATEIADQEAIVVTQQGKFDNGKAAWETSKAAYEGGVDGVNGAVDGLRAQLGIWQNVVTQINDASSTVTDLQEAQKTAIFNAIKTYYVTRYHFDRKTAYNVPTVPQNLADLSSTLTFNSTIFFTNVPVANYQAYINALTADSDVKIVNKYEWRNYADNGNPSNSYATISVSFPASTSTSSTVYVNSTIGNYLYLSRNVYGADAISDVHYYLPYDKRPTEKATGVPDAPSFNYYTASLFYNLDNAKNALAELKANAANTFYVENYKSVLGVVNRSIAFYEGLKTKYEEKIVEINEQIKEQEAVIAAQEDKVAAQKAVVQAAKIVSDDATVKYNAANTHATSLQNIFNQLRDASGTTLNLIKAKITEIENNIGDPSSGFIKRVQDANKALAEYIATGDGTDIIANKIAQLEGEIVNIDAQIAALEVIIQDIEARMQALLADE